MVAVTQVNISSVFSVSPVMWRDLSVVTELEMIFWDVGGKVEINFSELPKYHSAISIL